jgi:hypothetical protein
VGETDSDWETKLLFEKLLPQERVIWCARRDPSPREVRLWGFISRRPPATFYAITLEYLVVVKHGRVTAYAPLAQVLNYCAEDRTTLRFDLETGNPKQPQVSWRFTGLRNADFDVLTLNTHVENAHKRAAAAQKRAEAQRRVDAQGGAT